MHSIINFCRNDEFKYLNEQREQYLTGDRFPITLDIANPKQGSRADMEGQGSLI